MSDRVKVSYEKAVAMIPETKTVHTFVNGCPGVLIGADWDRDDLLQAFRKCEPELSGPMAARSGHGLCLWRTDHWVFVETKSNCETK